MRLRYKCFKGIYRLHLQGKTRRTESTFLLLAVSCLAHYRQKHNTIINEGKIPLRRVKCRWKDNINTDLIKIVLEGVDWINQSRDKDQLWDVMNTVMNL